MLKNKLVIKSKLDYFHLSFVLFLFLGLILLIYSFFANTYTISPNFGLISGSIYFGIMLIFILIYLAIYIPPLTYKNILQYAFLLVIVQIIATIYLKIYGDLDLTNPTHEAWLTPFLFIPIFYSYLVASIKKSRFITSITKPKHKNRYILPKTKILIFKIIWNLILLTSAVLLLKKSFILQNSLDDFYDINANPRLLQIVLGLFVLITINYRFLWNLVKKIFELGMERILKINSKQFYDILHKTFYKTRNFLVEKHIISPKPVKLSGKKLAKQIFTSVFVVIYGFAFLFLLSILLLMMNYSGIFTRFKILKVLIIIFFFIEGYYFYRYYYIKLGLKLHSIFMRIAIYARASKYKKQKLLKTIKPPFFIRELIKIKQVITFLTFESLFITLLAIAYLSILFFLNIMHLAHFSFDIDSFFMGLTLVSVVVTLFMCAVFTMYYLIVNPVLMIFWALSNSPKKK